MAKKTTTLRIRQVRSRIGQTKRQRESLRSLGLRRIGQVVERPDNAAVRGTVRAIGHLVRIEGPATTAPGTTESAPAPKAAKKKATKKTAKTASKKTTKKTAKKAKTSKAKTAKKKTAKKKASGGES